MKNLLLLFLLTAFSFTVAQQDSTRAATQKQTPKTPLSEKIYYGGAVGFNFFGDYFRISLEPMVGYKVTPKLSAGVKLMYEYVKDSRYTTDVTSNNYGGSVFTRFRVIPALYLHAEFAYYSYKYRTALIEGDRSWVPFLLLGAGYSQQITRNTWAYAQALWDVIQDDKSPYSNSEPWISVGVGVGF
ncbi:MAG: hypothetical protein L3J41_04805 [Melioribacteraceae bacterium]|nr:hypothetical protein [Melioribacteraceae bacterium]